MTDFRVTGTSEVIKALSKMSVEAEAAALRIVKRGQIVLNAGAKRQFTGSHPKGTPTTSSPGGPPDVVTGTLRRGIVSSTPEISPKGVLGKVYPTAIYSRIQELGGQFLPPRPYMSKTHRESKSKLGAIAVQEWRKVRPHV